MSISNATRKRVGVTLASLAIVGVGGIATTAYFTSEVNVEADIQAGTMEVKVGDKGDYELKLPDEFNPGAHVTDTVTVVNTGSIPARVTIAADTNDTDDSAWIDNYASQLISAVYEGQEQPDAAKLEKLEPFVIENLAPGEDASVEVSFYVEAPLEDIGNDWKGKTGTVKFDVVATQAGL